ncbi:hypothetical protein HQQ88_16340 [Curtobacterium sp. VKM Ac-2861]|uniref:DUF6036 family nucleotidyltransferase n=1 Tax=Curtobacterium sp. VKM Ac-2861 TaxID=2739016 RepID=UPI001563A309|nr:hypothetical protein [Curtobacterium sp. VKM Ac-2861]
MTEDYRLLSGAEVVDLLGELLERLAGRGVEVETYIVGGAAVAVQLGRDEVTPDIDGLFQPMDEVLVEARAMAAEHRLDPEWINSRAFSFMEFSPNDDTEALHTTINGRPVVVASKRRLLAMKLAASRPKDRTDLNRLIIDLDVRTADELVAIAREAYGEHSMTLPDDPAEVQLIAEEALRRADAWRRRTHTAE